VTAAAAAAAAEKYCACQPGGSAEAEVSEARTN
jgi:hypothetical protein